MKQRISLLLVLLLLLTGCSFEQGPFESSQNIHVISREDGSGTRGAFVQITGIEQKDTKGEKRDFTTIEASVTNSTSVVMSSVAGDLYGIGYLSLGSMNPTVKGVSVDGVSPTAEHIRQEKYPIIRPFILTWKEENSSATQDFLAYLNSVEGQKMIEETGYVGIEAQGPFVSNGATGKVVVGGSSSVTPMMEKLKESYMKQNPNVIIEIQQSDSTTGITSTAAGVYDIGMTSRSITPEEEFPHCQQQPIAYDGIVVIVNNNCPVENITTEDIVSVFTGEFTTWQELGGRTDA